MRRRPVAFAAALALSAIALAAPAPAQAAPTPTPTPEPTPTYELSSPDQSSTGPTPPPPTQQNLTPEPATVAAPVTISSGQLAVDLDPAFPRILRYTDKASGAVLDGSTAVPGVVLNGTPYQATVALRGTDGTSARYRLTVEAGVTLDASIRVKGRVTTFAIDAITDTETFRVNTIDLPGHDLVSVVERTSRAPRPRSPGSTPTPPVRPTSSPPSPRGTAPDAAPIGASYAIVNTGALAAAVESNSTYDRPSGVTDKDAARFWHQARQEDGGRSGSACGAASGPTGAAARPSPSRDLPWAKVVVTPDANGDAASTGRTARSRSGASASRRPARSETKDRVIAHIPFNFSSQATHPFLRTLDDVKRISLATDGLGQLALLKGYQSEGHDSAHPDYGGNYNKRAGGLADLNTLLKGGKKWNATFGVHVNATESYPEAKTSASSSSTRTPRAGTGSTSRY